MILSLCIILCSVKEAIDSLCSSSKDLQLSVALVAMRLFVCWFFRCSQISTGTSITLDSRYIAHLILHILLWIVMGWAALFCITRIVFLSQHLPYYKKTRVLCLILAAFPLIYQFMMIKFLHSYFASCFSDTIQIFGIFPATTLVLQTCFQFAFIIKPLEYGHRRIESELRNAASYISQYNLFMLFHLVCVQLLSLRVDGWKTDILFWGVFELFTRIWGYYSFKYLASRRSNVLIIVEEGNGCQYAGELVRNPSCSKFCTKGRHIVVACCSKIKEWYSESRGSCYNTITRTKQDKHSHGRSDECSYEYIGDPIDSTT